MIVDASAVLAVLLAEPDADEVMRLMVAGAPSRISAVNFVEAAIVAERPELNLGSDLDELLRDGRIAIAPVTGEQAVVARAAHARYGKGRHPARLNLGDCFAYALAKTANEPLLFKGNDFVHTDVVAAATS